MLLCVISVVVFRRHQSELASAFSLTSYCNLPLNIDFVYIMPSQGNKNSLSKSHSFLRKHTDESPSSVKSVCTPATVDVGTSQSMTNPIFPMATHGNSSLPQRRRKTSTMMTEPLKRKHVLNFAIKNAKSGIQMHRSMTTV